MRKFTLGLAVALVAVAAVAPAPAAAQEQQHYDWAASNGKLLLKPKVGVDQVEQARTDPNYLSVRLYSQAVATEQWREEMATGNAVCVNDLGPKVRNRFWLHTC